MLGKSWWLEHEVAGHTEFTVRKQTNTHAQLTFCFSFTSGHQPMVMVPSTLELGFPLQPT